jgi:hypothetical protein
MSKNSLILNATAAAVIAVGVTFAAAPAASAAPDAPAPSLTSPLVSQSPNPTNIGTILQNLAKISPLINRLLGSPNCDISVGGVQYCS